MRRLISYIKKITKNFLLKITSLIDYNIIGVERAFTLHEDVNIQLRKIKLPYFLAYDGVKLLLIRQDGFIPLFCISDYKNKGINAVFCDNLLIISYGDRELIITPDGRVLD